MVHLRPLPGSPNFDGDFDSVIAAATTDAELLAEAGFQGIMVENFGDAPFHASDAPKVTIASLTTAVNAVYDASRLPVGVNVLSGTMYTDQGPIVGEAAEIARLRSQICPNVAILADVFVKHATPPPGLTLTDATNDLIERAGADAVVVSGVGTGSPADLEQLASVAALSHLPVFVGSGVTRANVNAMLGIADGAIVGTAIKVGGVSTGPVDLAAATAFIQAAL